MTDRATFEARLTDAYARYVKPAPVGVNTSAVASTVAAVPRRTGWSEIRLLIVAALLLMGLLVATIVGTGGLPDHLLGKVSPSPSAAAPTAGPTRAAGAPAWEAIYLRDDPRDATVIDVLVVRPDGTERLLRRISTTLAGSSFPLSTAGVVSEGGWLAIGTTSAGQLPVAAYGLFDLAKATRDPLTVPYPPVIGGRWSSTGLFAVSSAKPCATGDRTCWMAIDIVDPRTGSTTELGRIDLFGGGPSIVWARDGSGILDGGLLRPVGGGPDVQVDPGLLFEDRRVGIGGRTIEVCPVGLPPGSGPCVGLTRTTVRVFDLAGEGVDWYSSSDPTEQVNAADFTADGRGVWLTIDRVVNGHHRAVIAVAEAPFQLRTIAAVDLHAGASNPGIWGLAPDDSQMLYGYATGPQDNPQPVPPVILHLDGTQFPAPSGTFLGYVPGPQAESWPAEGEYGSPLP